jgi:hypothetical protein
MLCLKYKRLLVPYMECELDERVRAKVERHVSRCARCAAELELIRSVSGAIKSAEMPAMEPAPDLWARVSARIEREATRPAPRPWIRVTQAASACAAAVFVAVVGISLMHTNPPPQSLPPASEKKIPAVANRAARSTGAETHGPAVASLPRPSRTAPAEGTRVAVGVSNVPAPPMRPHPGRKPAGSRSYPAAPPPVWYEKKDVDRLAEAPKPPAASPTDEEAVGDRVAVGTTAAKAATAAGAVLDTGVFEAPNRSASAPHGDLSRADFALAVPSAPPPAGTAEYGVSTVAKPSLDDASRIARSSPTSAAARSYERHPSTEVAGAPPSHFYADMGLAAGRLTVAGDEKAESVVDALNETEGVRIAALFTYP